VSNHFLAGRTITLPDGEFVTASLGKIVAEEDAEGRKEK